MIKIDRETSITLDGEDAWDLTQLASYVIEVLQTDNADGYGWDDERKENFKKLAYRLQDAISNEGFL